jgi:hypothetical protein
MTAGSALVASASVGQLRNDSTPPASAAGVTTSPPEVFHGASSTPAGGVSAAHPARSKPMAIRTPALGDRREAPRITFTDRPAIGGREPVAFGGGHGPVSDTIVGTDRDGDERPRSPSRGPGHPVVAPNPHVRGFARPRFAGRLDLTSWSDRLAPPLVELVVDLRVGLTAAEQPAGSAAGRDPELVVGVNVVLLHGPRHA